MRILASCFALLLTLGLVCPADELEDAVQCLKDAQAKSDVAGLKKAAVAIYPLASKLASEAQPANEADKDAWKQRVEYGQYLKTNTEYTLYTTSLKAPVNDAIELLATLEKQNPKSQYLEEGFSYYLFLLSKTGQTAKAAAVAESAVNNFPNNPDLLITLASSSMQRKQTDRALTYAKRTIAAWGKRAKPTGVSVAEWDRKKSESLSKAYWIAGVVEGQKNEYVDANGHLRAALPYIQSNNSMLAPALFYLSVANYQLGCTTLNKAQIREAIKFCEAAAAIKGPYSQQAYYNLISMRSQLAKMR
jgi:tetratricopeptide (TPR) repeat protein